MRTLLAVVDGAFSTCIVFLALVVALVTVDGPWAIAELGPLSAVFTVAVMFNHAVIAEVIARFRARRTRRAR